MNRKAYTTRTIVMRALLWSKVIKKDLYILVSNWQKLKLNVTPSSKTLFSLKLFKCGLRTDQSKWCHSTKLAYETYFA